LEDEKCFEINSRMAYILNVTMKDNVPISSVLRNLSISKRTFYLELKKTNDWLKFNDFGRIQIDKQRIMMTSKNSDKLLNRLCEANGYLFSVEERRALELLFITLTCCPVTIDTMQSFFDVSKNTILNDVGELKEIMSHYGIKIHNSVKKGYYCTGEEFSIRKVISKKVIMLVNLVPKAILQDLIQDSMNSICGKHIDYRLRIRVGIHEYENILQTHFVQSEIENVITMTFVALIRSSMKYELKIDAQEKAALAVTQEYKTVQMLVGKWNEELLVLPENETYYITILFLGIKNVDFNRPLSEKNFIHKITEAIIKNFVQISGLKFRKENVLYNRLYLHIKPLYYRLKYGVHISNPIIGNIKTMYPDIFEYTSKAVQMTGGEIASLITEDEIGYLCIYMASFLNDYQEEKHKKHNKKKILIVCGAGVSTSVLIREQLQSLLGDMFFYQLAPAYEIKESNLSDYLFVISSVILDYEGKNIIYTGPILEDKTKMQISEFLKQCNYFGDYCVTLRDVIKTLKDENIQFNEPEMFLKLLRHYQQNFNE
jgi:mannitol operon transcriptional antiterminator